MMVDQRSNFNHLSMPQPLVSIITVNYNQPEVTYELLDSVSKLTYPRLEILLVDNGSNLNSLDERRIHSILPQAILIKSQQNVGFGGGNNLAISMAKGDYLFLVNNDTEVTPDLIELLLVPFYEDPHVGVVCPMIMYYLQTNLIQYAGFSPIHPLTGRNHCIGFQEEDIGQYSNQKLTSGAHGAAMMVSRKVIEITGSFYSPFFLYYEETDWSCRILKDGFKIIIQPKAKIYHKESISVGKNSTLKTFYLTRNRFLYMKRNNTRLRYASFVLFYFIFSIPKNIIQYLLKKEFAHLKAFINGTIKGLSIQAYEI